MLDRFTVSTPQAQATPELYRLTASKNLANSFELFILNCKVEDLSPATIHDYRVKTGRFLQFCAKQEVKSPGDITVHHIRLFLLSRKETNCSLSVLGYYKCVQRFLNWLVEEGALETNPMAHIKPPRVPMKIITPLTQEQINKLLLLCEDDRLLGRRNRAIILTFLDTGLRRKELASIQLADVNFDREIIKVMGKGARERVVRIGKHTQRALMGYILMRKDNCSCLWINEVGAPLTADGIRQMLEVLGKRARLQGVRCSPHTFRHTFATMALLNGAGEFNVQSLLGHSDLRMTRRYTASLTSERAVEAHKKFSPVDRMGV